MVEFNWYMKSVRQKGNYRSICWWYFSIFISCAVFIHLNWIFTHLTVNSDASDTQHTRHHQFRQWFIVKYANGPSTHTFISPILLSYFSLYSAHTFNTYSNWTLAAISHSYNYYTTVIRIIHHTVVLVFFQLPQMPLWRHFLHILTEKILYWIQ